MSRKLIAAAAALAMLPLAGQDAFRPAKLLPLPLTSVRIQDKFWAPRMKTNRSRTLETVRQRLLETGAIQNFSIAAKKSPGKYRGPFWTDSDVYKWLEGVAYSLVRERDPKLEAQADEVIAAIAAAQQPDGYLNTYFQLVQPDLKWKFLAFGHEMYCAGHLFEAAVAHFEATGKRTLLDIAVKNADHIAATFGAGKHDGQPGHEEIEVGLMKLYRATGGKRYLQLAQFFIDQRGRKPSYFEREYATHDNRTLEFLGRTITLRTLYDELFRREGKFDTQYSQDHLPARRQDKVVGHAVRAMYFYSGMADIAAETGDREIYDALVRLYRDLTGKRMYVTGGIGPSAHNEGFTFDYDLPNETAYQETCASIGVAMWMQRMLALTGDGRYADTMELALYNAVPAGVSLAGDVFFYDNPLYSAGKTARKTWFTVPCCPTNIVRTMPSIAKYAYSQSEDALWVNLYVQGEATATFADKSALSIVVETDYPWAGDAKLRIAKAPDREAGLNLRVPGWSARADIRVNGTPVAAAPAKGYLALRRQWKAGDAVAVSLPMPVERLEAHPAVAEDRGRVALRRGPVIYCLEQADNRGDIDSLFLPVSSKLEARFEPSLLNGVAVIVGQADRKPARPWGDDLYRPVREGLQGPAPFRAAPYCTWANRGPGKMTVWIEGERH